MPIDGCRGLSRGVLLRAALDKSEGTSKSLRGWKSHLMCLDTALQLIKMAITNTLLSREGKGTLQADQEEAALPFFKGGLVSIRAYQEVVTTRSKI